MSLVRPQQAYASKNAIKGSTTPYWAAFTPLIVAVSRLTAAISRRNCHAAFDGPAEPRGVASEAARLQVAQQDGNG